MKIAVSLFVLTIGLTQVVPGVVAQEPQVGKPETIPGNGPEAEREAVRKVLGHYLAVVDTRDKSAIARAFHPTAVLSTVTNAGSVASMTQDVWWERVSRIPQSAAPRTSTIRLVEVAGITAIARIDIVSAAGTSSTDMFTLLKTADGWRIINKTLSTPL